MPRRRVPQRTCVICRTTTAKRGLVRVVRTPEGALVVDSRGKISGRGAYLCPRPGCFGSGHARGAVVRALGVELGEDEWSALEAELARVAVERVSASDRDAQRVPGAQR